MSKQRPQPLSCEVEMNMLSRIMAKVGQHIELDRVLDTVITELCNALDLNAGCIYVFDEATAELKLRTHQGLSPAFLEARGTLASGEGCAGAAFITKETFVPTKAERRFVCGTEKSFWVIAVWLPSPYYRRIKYWRFWNSLLQRPGT